MSRRVENKRKNGTIAQMNLIRKKLEEQEERLVRQEEILGLFYTEYREMKKSNQREHLMPVIRMREDFLKDISNLLKKGYREQDDVIRYLHIYMDECTTMLEDNGVEILSCERGEVFSPEIEKPLESRGVPHPSYHNLVLEAYGDGYRWNGIMLHKINVAVGIYR